MIGTCERFWLIIPILSSPCTHNVMLNALVGRIRLAKCSFIVLFLEFLGNAQLGDWCAVASGSFRRRLRFICQDSTGPMLCFSQMDRMVGKNRRTFKTLQILVLCFFLLFPFFFLSCGYLAKRF